MVFAVCILGTQTIYTYSAHVCTHVIQCNFRKSKVSLADILSHTLSLSHTYYLSHTPYLALTLTYTLSLSPSLSLTRSQHTLSLSRSLFFSLALSLFSLVHSHSPYLYHSLPLFLPRSRSRSPSILAKQRRDILNFTIKFLENNLRLLSK